MKRAAWRVREATSAATTGCLCRWQPISRRLNRKLLEDCRADEGRIMSGQSDGVGTRLLTEKEHLLPLAAEPFDLAEVSFPRVDQSGCAKGADELVFRAVEAGLDPLKPASIPGNGRVPSPMAPGSPATNAVTADCRRSSIWNTTSTCWTGSQERCAVSTPLAQWRAQGRCLRVTTGSAADDRAARTPARRPCHGDAHPHGPRVRLREADGCRRTGARPGLRRRRRDPPSAAVRSVAAHRRRADEIVPCPRMNAHCQP